MILDQAWALHLAARRPYGRPRDHRLAYPFGTPRDMPPHHWRVSRDVMQGLYDASPSYPKPSLGATPSSTAGRSMLTRRQRLER